MGTKEVVVVTAPAGVNPLGMPGEGAEAVDELSQIIAQHGVVLEPMFPVASELSAPSAQSGELDRYFRIEVDADRAEKLADQLRGAAQVETAYVKPGVENPLAPDEDESLAAPFLAGSFPDFSTQQGYLDASPYGVNAPAAWAQPGGKGDGVTVIDIEGGWCLDHRDLLAKSVNVVAGAEFPDYGWRNHGTAVLGEIVGDESGSGVTGISPGAKMKVVSHGGLGAAKAIFTAAEALNPGDIMLLEMHAPGPRFKFASRKDQRGYIAVEWWPDNFVAIQYAVAKGIIVVGAAGNGAENLDDPIYDAPDRGFPASWKNPFRRDPVDSGAIIVGAGAPPGGLYGHDRSRLSFSNFGALVDCQGWGRGVTTTGYGDLYGAGGPEHEWYTSQFSGTSSASPIIVGVLACLQGIAKANKRLLTPKAARKLMRDHGAPQHPSGAPDRIGARPDLSVLISKV